MAVILEMSFELYILDVCMFPESPLYSQHGPKIYMARQISIGSGLGSGEWRIM